MEQVVFLNKPKDIQQSLLTVEQNNILSTSIEWCYLNYNPEKNTVSPYHYHCKDVMNYWYINTTLIHHVSIEVSIATKSFYIAYIDSTARRALHAAC